MKKNGPITHTPAWPLIGKLVVGGLLLAMVIVLMLWFSNYWTAKIQPRTATALTKPQRYDGPAVAVRFISVPVQFFAVGTLEPIEPVTLASRILGKVIFSRLHSGELVRRNEILVQLDKSQLTAQLNQAIADQSLAVVELHQAAIDYHRAAALFKTADVTKADIDWAGTRLAAAKARLASMRAATQDKRSQLSYAALRCPINGVVLEKNVNAGDTIMPGQTLATVYSPGRLQLTTVVPESLQRHIRLGQMLVVRLSGFRKPIAVHVRRILPRVSVQTRSFLVKVSGSFPAGIFPGMFGRLEIPIRQEKVLVVPANAIEKIGQLDMVTIISGGALQRRIVQPGRHFGALREILSGVTVGEKLAVGGTVHG